MSETISVAGVSVGLGRTGDGDAPALVIHCSLGRHQALARLARLIGKTHRVTLFDMPGHGLSDPLEDGVDFQDLTTRIATELIEPDSHVIGHSFGGTVALRLAVERPDLVSRVTLCEPVCFTPILLTKAYADYLDRFAPYVGAMARGDRSRAAEVFHTQWGEGAWDVLPYYVKADLTDRIHMIAKGLPGAEGDPGAVFAPGRLEQLSCPVTLIRGERSEPIMREVHAAILARLRHGREVVIEGAGHMVPVTHPGTVAAAIG
ncbi:alpha/beta fold hydrolase [Flavimaricola marinus]|uniref:Dihydrolipoyllysine-residue acetyltransferase component of acetoin cleaving system n=1 Tax=Flavimaricola marinus TaxID=1819565 RepID=A0A238L8M6_9RHOB|nr:alpha/beta hydrolase [Flavimaricola marinus]SMY05951.1 Dihydrolipoyllysine-residue acetyltransferase component of acetoin cleaving system [Flavimaricola marinus]